MPEWMVDRIMLILMIYAGLVIFLLHKVKIGNKILKNEEDKEKLIFSKGEEAMVKGGLILLIVMVITTIARLQRVSGHAGWISLLEGCIGAALLVIIPPNGTLLRSMANLMDINRQRKKTLKSNESSK